MGARAQLLHLSINPDLPQWEYPSSMGTFVLTRNLRSPWESSFSMGISVLRIRFEKYVLLSISLRLIAPNAVNTPRPSLHQVRREVHGLQARLSSGYLKRSLHPVPQPFFPRALFFLFDLQASANDLSRSTTGNNDLFISHERPPLHSNMYLLPYTLLTFIEILEGYTVIILIFVSN